MISELELAEVMDDSWPAIEQEQTVLEAIQLLNKLNLEYLPVVEQGKLVGELWLSAMVRSTLMDIRHVAISHIMRKPQVNLNSEEYWPDWAQVVAKITPVVDASGSYVGITSPELINKGFSKMLKYHLERFEAVLDCTHNGIMAIDSQGCLVIFNQAAARFLKLAPEDVLGKPVESLFPNTGLLEVLHTGEPQYSQEISYGNRSFLSNRTPIISEGKIVGAVAVFQDISELTRVSQQLDLVNELHQELDAVIQHSHDGICITDNRGVILRLNPSFQRVTGLTAEMYLGKNLAKLLEDGVMDNSATLEVLQSGKPVTVMQNFHTGKHTISTAYPVFAEDGSIFRVVTNTRDVTELNLLREELEQSKLLASQYQLELSKLTGQTSATEVGIIGHSEAIGHVLDLAQRVARVDSTVLLLGESGVGKEIIAQYIHRNSTRKETGLFVELNCGAIPKELLESELFGYEGGAFTGAKREGKLGYFELAHQGTLFLDEIADLPLELQVKLLRVLQEQELVRIGGQKSIEIDVRIIAATNRDLEQMVEAGEFRNDLYYRLHVVPIAIPPLRERREDIAPLLLHYLKKFNHKYDMHKLLAKETIELLEHYPWQGNVRELVNLVERLVVVSPNDLINPDYLPSQVRAAAGAEYRQAEQPQADYREPEYSTGAANTTYESSTLKEALDQVEMTMLKKALEDTNNYHEAAALLDVSIATLNRKLEKHQLQRRKA